MRRVVYALLLLATIAAAFLAGFWSHQHATVGAAALRAPRILHYACPMHPAYRSDRPADCPACGMALEPVYEDRGHADAAGPGSAAPPAAIAISAGTQQLIGVRVGTVEQISGTERLRLFGRVTPEETRLYRINVGVDGYIREISAVTTGSQVVRDQWLATFSAPDTRQPIQAFLVTLDALDRQAKSGADSPVALDVARAGSEQAVDRLLTLGMSRVQVEEIRRTRLVPPSVQVTAPAEGFVLARNVSTGQKLEKGTELFRIADLRRVWILADVAARDADFVRPGMTAEVTIPGRPTPIPARVSRDVRPEFDPAAQSLKVRLEAENPDYRLRPDMFVDVDLQSPYRAAIVVPDGAIVASGLRNSVFVERGPGSFEPLPVEIGRRFGGRVEIVKGLAPGDRIVVSGTFLLDSESRMRTHDQPDH